MPPDVGLLFVYIVSIRALPVKGERSAEKLGTPATDTVSIRALPVKGERCRAHDHGDSSLHVSIRALPVKGERCLVRPADRALR